MVLLPVSMTPQTATGAIQGMVVDSSGAAIPGVRVTAVDAGTGAARAALTDGAGQFRFVALAVGDYELRLEKDGFAKVVVSRFPVSLGQMVVQRVEMKPAQVIETLEVKEQPEALETTATASSAALGGERIEESPAQNRNYLNFALMAPGVAASAGSNTQRSAAGVRSASPDSGFSFGGLRGRNNSLLIDGVDNRDETTGGNRVAIGLEMVQEFRVSGATLGAEFGGAAGGSVNVVTRSGANLWHGDATFFSQNEAPNARDPEADSLRKPRFRRYQPGVSVLGPVRRDRTFFATALEQEWESGEEWSEAPPGVPGLYRGLFPSGSAQTEFSFKANHQFRQIHALSARYAFSRGRVSNDVQASDNSTERSARGSSLTRDHSFVGGWVSVPQPRLVNDFRLQVARRTVDLTPNSRGAMLEIPGVVTFGQAYNLDSARAEDHYEIVEGLNLAQGRHQFSLGGSVHVVRLDARIANRFAGIFVFPTLDHFLRGAPDVFLQAFGEPRTRFTTVPAGFWVQDRWQAATGVMIEAGLRYDFQGLPAPFSSATRNLAPRFGLAFRPGGKGPYVFRAGFGLFFDRYPLAFLNDAIQKDGAGAFEQYLTGALAARAFAISRGSSLAAPLDGAGVSTYQPDATFPATYARKFTAGLQRSLGKDTTLTVEYASVRGFHLPRIRNASGSLPPLYQLEQAARSSFHGVSVTLNRRMSRELTYLFAYTGGRAHDDASDFDEHPMNPRDARADWARSRQHQAHRLAASGLFELPVQAAPAWLRETLDDVVVSPIVTAGTGRPVNALDSTDAFRTGAYPISARPFGFGRNPFRSPGSFSLDLRILKGFWLKERRAILQVGVEAFNLTNHSNPLRVSPYFAAAGTRLASYRQPVEMLNARQLQLVVQIEY